MTDSAGLPALPSPPRPGVPVVGMVGAGPLARMTGQAAIGLGVGFRVLAGSVTDSAAQVLAGTVVGDYRSIDDLRTFAAGCDVLTVEHEHVPAAHLAMLERSGVLVRPGAAALSLTQDKLAMRQRLTGLGIELIAEEHVEFQRELTVLAARSPHGQGAAYPVAQTIRRDGIRREVLAPAPGLSPLRAAQAQELVLRIAAELGVTGLLAVEMVETPGGLLVNDLAMRPHFGGHWTIEGARTSQFEQHLRAVLDLPLGSPALAAPAAATASVLGGDDADVYDRYVHVMAADPAVRVHIYGRPARPGCAIGHVTVTGDRAHTDLAGLADRARRAASYLGWGREDGD